MIKKTFSMLVCGMLVMSLALTGCGKKEKTSEKNVENTGTVETAANYKVDYFDGGDDGIIAEVNGEKVTEDEFRYFLMVSMMNKLNSGDTTAQNNKEFWTDKKLDEILESAMNQCVLLHVYRTAAIDDGVKLTDEDMETVKQQLDSVKEYYGDDIYELYLEAEALTEEMYNEFNLMSYYATKNYEKYTQDAVSDSEISKYFKKNYVKAKHILISKTNDDGADISADAYSKIEDIKAQLEGGADFDALMNEHGEDPGVSSSPDGYIFTTGEMVAEFEEAAFALEPGEISDIVETSYGYHIIKKIELKDSDMSSQLTDSYGNTSTYKEAVRNVIAGNLYSAYIEDVKANAKVKVNNSIYKKFKNDAVKMYDEYYENGNLLYQQINALQQAAETEDE